MSAHHQLMLILEMTYGNSLVILLLTFGGATQ